MRDDPRARWTEWIEGPIHDAVLTLFHRRQIWRGIVQVIHERKAPLPDSAFWQYHVDLYAATQAISVRRQADRRRDVISLERLLIEIGERPDLITADWWVGLWTNERDERFPRHYWAEKFGGGECLQPDIPAEKSERLRHASNDVKRYVDEHLAHTKNPNRGTPAEPLSLTLDALDYAIDTVGAVFQECFYLLTAGDFLFLEPTIQHDWLAPFRLPWIEED